MMVVVNDANLLINLIKIQLTDAFFQIRWEFHTTSLIIENELFDDQKLQLKPYMERGRLIVQELNPGDLLVVLDLQTQKPQLSDKDCSALYVARKLNAALLTSDNTLRKFAQQAKVEVHGHLWVFDAMLEHQCIRPSDAISKLKELNAINPRLKLPPKECEARMEKWKNMKEW